MDRAISAPMRLAGVDVLRGICVLLVVLHHTHLRFVLNDYPVNVLPEFFDHLLFWSARYAVVTFFVISGFLITGLSIRRWNSLGNVPAGRFYQMRFARIAPCLLLLLMIASVLHLVGAGDFVIKPERASLARALLAALTFHVNWLEGHRGYLPGNWDVLWSLSVEEVFYVLFPLACLLLRSERVLLLPLTCLVVAAPISRVLLADQDPWGSYAYLSCSDGIAFGCIVALACARLQIGRQLLRASLVIGAAMAVSIFVFTNEDSHTGLAAFGLNDTLLEVGVALILLALGNGVGNGTMSRGTGWLRAIGYASYEIYLFHMLVVLSLMMLFRHLQPPGKWIPAWYAAMVLGSLVLGGLIARFYSEPLNRLLRPRRTA